MGGACIHCILQQLLDGAGGALDDLAGGDLVRDVVGQELYQVAQFFLFLAQPANLH